MKSRRFAMLVLLGSLVVVAPIAECQIKHIEMRVEGMT
jgi:Ca2+/H+ antiporter